jgi:hypothetical protein
VNLELDVFQEVIDMFRQHSRDLEMQFQRIAHLQADLDESVVREHK